LEKRRIGDLEVSVAGLGCNNFGKRLDARGTREVVAAALETAGGDWATAAIVAVIARENGTLQGCAIRAGGRQPLGRQSSAPSP
jgi:hypothetical protein